MLLAVRHLGAFSIFVEIIVHVFVIRAIVNHFVKIIFTPKCVVELVVVKTIFYFVMHIVGYVI